MEDQILKDGSNRGLILILTMFTLIGSNMRINIIIFICGLFCWFEIYILSRKKHNHEVAILRMLILSIPLSFIDIFGNPYGESLISWFNIFFLIAVITYLLKYSIIKKIYFDHLSLLSLLLIMISIIPVIIGGNFFDGLKQYINIIVSFLLIVIGNSFKYNISDRDRDTLKIDYISATIITAIGLIIQIFFIQILNIEIGNYNFFGGYRHAYGFLFADYSFLSLYLSSGAMMLYSFDKKNIFPRGRFILYFGLILVTSILTSARTGIVAFIAVFIFYNLPNILTLIKKGSIKSISIISGIILMIFSSYFLVDKTRGIAKFSDSGRMALNRKAFGVFKENPFLGIGFGSTNYEGMLPHNLLFQYLAQGGLLFTIPLILFLLIVVWTAYKRDKSLVPPLMCVLLGSFFVPNIFDSRFVPILFLLISIKKTNVNNI